MAPKAAANGEADQSNGILVLCQIMAECSEFKVDMSKVGEICGLAHPKNAPRKINGIIGPYGFEFKGGRVIANGDGVSTPNTPTVKVATTTSTTKSVGDTAAKSVSKVSIAQKRGKGNRAAAPTSANNSGSGDDEADSDGNGTEAEAKANIKDKAKQAPASRKRKSENDDEAVADNKENKKGATAAVGGVSKKRKMADADTVTKEDSDDTIVLDHQHREDGMDVDGTSADIESDNGGVKI